MNNVNNVNHEALAIAWAQYNSLSGRATPKQVAKVMRQLDVDSLVRMLAQRGITVTTE